MNISPHILMQVQNISYRSTNGLSHQQSNSIPKLLVLVWVQDSKTKIMLREILFKGETLKGKRLVGSLIQQGAFYYIQNKQGGNDRVIENTIGQYTGKKDANDIPIFETDKIVRQVSGTIYEVIYNDCEFSLKSVGKLNGRILALNSFESEDLLIQNN